jgi:hypothetical protein
MAASMPVPRQRRKSGAVTSGAAGSPEGAELHKRSAEASGFDCHARLAEPGRKRGRPGWRVYGIRKDDDG